MNTTSIALGHEPSDHRSLGTAPVLPHEVETRFADRGIVPTGQPLPPTRAARSPRSRGVFLAASAHSRLLHRIVNVVCIAVAAVSIVAAAQFAEPVLNGKFVSSNAGPPLVAATMRAPVFATSRAH
jgi:hypothetical protein